VSATYGDTRYHVCTVCGCLPTEHETLCEVCGTCFDCVGDIPCELCTG
jgi:hypothetical protein